MSGLLKPYAAKKLVSTLKQEVGLPIHLHTHDTTGNQVAALLMAAEAGVDVVDVRLSPPLSGLTSQPSLNAVVAALQRHGARHRPGSCAACRSSATIGPTCACAMRTSTTA